MRFSRRTWVAAWLWLLCAAGVQPARSQQEPQPSPAVDHGPLGETPAQIDHRYGPVRRHNARVRHHQVLEGGAAMDGDLHEKNGIIIRVVYCAGHAALLEYNRGAGPLSAADVGLLLKGTGGGFPWKAGEASTAETKLYNRGDNRAVAHWTTDAEGSLLIATEDGSNFSNRLLP